MSNIERFKSIQAQLKDGVRVSKEDFGFFKHYQRCSTNLNRRRIQSRATFDLVIKASHKPTI